ncbi:MAG: 50S ribosomal protein L34e, partial [Candidatus Methanofastidiosa archaeon]|nr:50S ribosomal protein L34e [Candidatus Methanofastidiosa archaeon]
MPRPMYRSRSLKRKNVRTPSGKVVTHYREKRTGTPHCSECGAILG